jgi:hypothetical protein
MAQRGETYDGMIFRDGGDDNSVVITVSIISASETPQNVEVTISKGPGAISGLGRFQVSLSPNTAYTLRVSSAGQQLVLAEIYVPVVEYVGSVFTATFGTPKLGMFNLALTPQFPVVDEDDPYKSITRPIFVRPPIPSPPGYPKRHRHFYLPGGSTDEDIEIGLGLGAQVLSKQPKIFRVRVLFATNRCRGSSGAPNRFFTNRRRAQDGYDLGECEVSIPNRHRIGRIERPRWWRLEWKEDPRRHVVLLRVTTLSTTTFYNRVTARAKAARPHEQAFVFIHGYNVKFADAMRRTAQLAYDLQFAGAPICFTWPGEEHFRRYIVAEGTADWFVGHFAAFLDDLIARTNLKAHFKSS